MSVGDCDECGTRLEFFFTPDRKSVLTDHVRELQGAHPTYSGRVWCPEHRPFGGGIEEPGFKALPLDALDPQDRYLQLLVDGMEKRDGVEPTTLVSVARLRAMEATLGLLRLTYRPMDPWETYIIRTDLEQALASIPATEEERLLADLVQMREDLA